MAAGKGLMMSAGRYGAEKHIHTHTGGDIISLVSYRLDSNNILIASKELVKDDVYYRFLTTYVYFFLSIFCVSLLYISSTPQLIFFLCTYK